MAEKHILSLEVPTVANPEILSIIDTSSYSDKIPVDCSELLITTPGFNKPALIKVEPGFSSHFNACDLEIQNTNCGTIRNKLPDGIYIIKYSVSPNDKVYVEYNHMRVTSLLTLYYEALCSIDVNSCEPEGTRRDVISEMKYIKTLIDAAVANVEYCHSPNKGMDLYSFAKKRLSKITCRLVGC